MRPEEAARTDEDVQLMHVNDISTEVGQSSRLECRTGDPQCRSAIAPMIWAGC
jgi:hypothetical protein